MDYQIFGNIVDIHKKSIFPGEIIIHNGIIREIKHTKNKSDVFILPGLVDAHIHIESSLLTPGRFAEIAVRHGTVAAVCDPHEIANVCGIDGIDFMLQSSASVPFHFCFGVPSCIPATSFETNGSEFGLKEIEYLFKDKNLSYLAEMMNFPGVIHHDKQVMNKILLAKKYKRKIDGHAPGLTGQDLQDYVNAGISTDHECVSFQEAEEKIKAGMKILIREGSAARNFENLAPLISKYPNKIMLCTDDCHPEKLKKEHINGIIQRGLILGLNIFDLLRAASINPILHYNLKIGLLREGDPADLIKVKDLHKLDVIETWIKGDLAYNNGKTLFKVPNMKPVNQFNAKKIELSDIKIRAIKNNIRVINIVDGELLTFQSIEKAKIENGEAQVELEKDILKLVVLNRYSPAKPQVAFIRHMGLKKGAIAGTVAHDSHNIIAVGANDQDIVVSINRLIECKGGLIAVNGNKEIILPLEVAGLMTQQPAENVADQMGKLNAMAWESGSTLQSPFMTLSFLSLLVIPHLKLSDQGLFNVDTFSFTELFTD